MRVRVVTALVTSAVTVLGGSLSAVSASAATKPGAAAKPGAAVISHTPAVKRKSPTAGDMLPDLVSSTPLTDTPNISGHNSCGKLCGNSTVYSTAVVNGEVVVAGAFTSACSPSPTGFAPCPTGTAANYIMAFNVDTGAIDPDFTPQLTDGPVFSLAAGSGDTVYAGGAFTAVNGTNTGGIAALTVDPGQSDDGQLVPGFNGITTAGRVSALAYSGNALYVGGAFTRIDGKKYPHIARLNATTGAVDTTFKFTLGDPIEGSLIVNTLSVTPDGNTLAVGGSFLQVDGQSIPRIALINTGGGLGLTASLDNWASPVLSNGCSAEHDYVNSIDFSPDGSFFAVATTGYEGGGICDAVAKFETGATGTNVQPAWINYTGGDSYHSVAVVGNVIYAGGHNRWVNNECGKDHMCEVNALLVNGLSAFDPNTGLALPWWHPMTLRKTGVQSLVPFTSTQDPGSQGGLIVGTDGTTIGGAAHSELAIFPETSTAPLAAGGPIPSGMFSQGRVGGTDGTSNGTAEMCVDDPGNSSTPGTQVDFSTCTNGNGQNWAESGTAIQINGLCLDTQGAGTAPGTQVVLNTCTGAATQQWAQGAGNTVTNGGAPGLCLDDPLNASTHQPSLVNGTVLEINTCDGAASQVWPLPVAQAPPPPPPVGVLWPNETQSSSNVPCATSAAKKPKNGVTKVELSGCLNYDTQNWTVQSNGEIQIYGFCLDTVGEGVSSGTLVVLGTCTGSPTQTWTSHSNYELTDGAGMCLDDPGFQTGNGTQLEIYSCNDGTNQQWRMPAV
jgi:Ricin-type beta-trefoil lectin domain/Domain of unknown function (DUF5122) beta-propeller